MPTWSRSSSTTRPASPSDLIAAGADVTEYTRPVPGGLEVHVVATQEEQDDLRARGFAVGGAVVTDEQTEAVVAEREAAIERVDQLSTLAIDTLTVLRSEWFTSIGGVTYLNIEVKSSTGADSSPC